MRNTDDISQRNLIKKIIAYLDIVGDQPLSVERKNLLSFGLCFGFSVVHAYMAAKSLAGWWENVLKIISRWDERSASLDKILLDVPEGFLLNIAYPEKTQITYRNLLSLLVNYVLYNQAQASASMISGVEQHTFLTQNGHFYAENGDIQFYERHENLSEDELVFLLSTIHDASPFEGMLFISGNNHRCSFRYDKQHENWLFYDPNDPHGERNFHYNTHALLCNITEKLGEYPSVTLAGFVAMPSNSLSYWRKAYSSNFLNYWRKTYLVDLLGKKALHLIAWSRPQLFTEIMTLIKEDQPIRKALAKALTTQDEQGWTILHLHDIPTAFSEKIIVLAKEDQHIRNAIVAALKTQSKDKYTGMDSLSRFSPALFTEIIALAQEHQDMREALIMAEKIEDMRPSYRRSSGPETIIHRSSGPETIISQALEIPELKHCLEECKRWRKSPRQMAWQEAMQEWKKISTICEFIKLTFLSFVYSYSMHLGSKQNSVWYGMSFCNDYAKQRWKDHWRSDYGCITDVCFYAVILLIPIITVATRCTMRFVKANQFFQENPLATKTITYSEKTITYSDIICAIETITQKAVDISPDFTCPITHEIMMEPMYISHLRKTGSKHCYERHALTEWFEKQKKQNAYSQIPLTGERFTSSHKMHPDIVLGEFIDAFMQALLRQFKQDTQLRHQEIDPGQRPMVA